MKRYNNYEKYMSILLLIGAVAFNLWLYRLEPTAKIDPNDNAFQYALVDRTNQIWDFANKTCPKNLSFVICHLSFLIDHWVPNWNEGYNLPYYYSHAPQILIVASYRVLSSVVHQVSSLFQQCNNVTMQQCVPSLFQYYHFIIYLLLSLFPLPVFWALRIIGLPWLTAGVGALLATHISTDGLYGLDPPSFLWRGYGLSSQLFAMFFLPLAIAYSYRFFNNLQSTNYGLRNLKSYFLNHKSAFFLAVFFLFATTAGHLGIGIIALLSVPVLALAPPLFSFLTLNMATLSHSYIDKKRMLLQCVNVTMYQLLKLLLLFGGVMLLLGYWIIPAIKDSMYHNISVWDPIWKFNSYGAKEVLVRLFNGDLFDFGRFPLLTILVFVGFFTSLYGAGSLASTPYFHFALLFIFWVVLYFGRTTWGGLIDLIPGMREFHLSRFIVGIHLAGFFLVPIGIQWILSSMYQCSNATVRKLLHGHIVTLSIAIGLIVAVYPRTIRYNDLNNKLIIQANTNFARAENDVNLLFTELGNLPPARIFAGRGGTWGNNLRIAETPYFMHLSTYGLPTVLWMPETWSPNSDTEQYFSENRLADYELYNIRYVVAPPSQAAEPFWQLLKETPSWKLYQVEFQCDDVIMKQCNNETTGYITSGVRPAVVATSKENFLNVVRLWIQSDYPRQGLYPELLLSKNVAMQQLNNLLNNNLPRFIMKDEVTYETPDTKIHNLFAEPPRYIMPNDKCQMPAPSEVERSNESETMKQCSNVAILSQSQESNMIFKAKVEVPKDCIECLIVLKQTYHPNWRATVDGREIKAINVFPFFAAIPINQGAHEVIFSYQPASLKLVLLLTELVVIVVILFRILFKAKKST